MTEELKPKISANAAAVLERRYLMKNEQGKTVETVEGSVSYTHLICYFDCYCSHCHFYGAKMDLGF